MDIKVLVRKGVSEALEFLGEAEGNSALADELKEKTRIHGDRLRLMVGEGLLKKSDERVVVKTVPVKRKRVTYSISDKGKRLLELCGTLSKKEATDFLRVSPQQLDALKFFLKEGPKRPRDIPDITSKLSSMIQKGFLAKKTDEAEESHDVYRVKRTYTLTEKGTESLKALQTIKSL